MSRVTPFRKIVVGALALLVACSAPRPRLTAPLSYAPRPAAPDEAFRQRPPATTPIDPSSSFAVETTELSNGVRVLFVPRHDLPIFSARLLVARGARDFPGLRGELLQLAMGALIRGDQAAALGAPTLHATARCDADRCELETYGERPALPSALKKLGVLARSSTYPADQMPWIRNEWAAALERHRPTADNLRSLLFPPQDAYARPTIADSKRIRNLTVEELGELHRLLYRPEHATLIVAGDATLEDVRVMAEKAFHDWQSSRPIPRNMTEPPRPGASVRSVFVTIPSALVYAAVAARAPIADDPAADALSVLAASLGTPDGALEDEVRSHLGASYGVSASIQLGRQASTFKVEGAFEPDRSYVAVEAVLAAIRRARDVGLSQADFESARDRSIVAQREHAGTVRGATELLADAVSRGAPADSESTRIGRLRRLTRGDVQAAAKVWLSEDALRLVVAGPAEQIAPLAALKIGDAEWRNLSGETVSGPKATQ
jgi:zinc protease